MLGPAEGALGAQVHAVGKVGRLPEPLGDLARLSEHLEDEVAGRIDAHGARDGEGGVVDPAGGVQGCSGASYATDALHVTLAGGRIIRNP